MAEYIEREAAKDAIFEYICGHTMSKFPSEELLRASTMGAEGAFNELDYVPAADVVEVRHGCWIVMDNRLHLDVKCSVCKSSFYVYKQGQYRIEQSNYCPNCGAKMDGKGEG